MFHSESDIAVTCGSVHVLARPVHYSGAEAYINYPTVGLLYGLAKRFPLALNTSYPMSEDYEKNLRCLRKERDFLEPESKYTLEQIFQNVLSLRSALEVSDLIRHFHVFDRGVDETPPFRETNCLKFLPTIKKFMRHRGALM